MPGAATMRAGRLREGFERRDSVAALWSVRCAVFAFVLFLVAAPSHRYGLLETVAFLWTLGIVGLLGLAALLLSALGFADLWQRGDRAGRRSLVGLLVALVTLAPFLVGGWRFAVHPPLSDVATDVADPPALVAAVAHRDPRARPVTPITPGAAAMIAEHYPQVSGRRYEVAPERVLQAILAILGERGWTVSSTRGGGEDDVEITVEARAGSFLLRFPADVAVRLTDEGPTTYVDMRSASHFGRHDLGDNAMRITRFLAELDAAVEALPEQGLGGDQAGE